MYFFKTWYTYIVSKTDSKVPWNIKKMISIVPFNMILYLYSEDRQMHFAISISEFDFKNIYNI